MKKLIVLAGVAAFVLAPASQRIEIKARGGVLLGHHHDNPGSVVVDLVHEHGHTSGFFQYAAEDHDHDHERKNAAYPHLIIRLNHFDRTRIDGDTVFLSGHGHLNEEHILIDVELFDGARTNQPDRVKVTCLHGRHIHYKVDKPLATGDIAISRFGGRK
jgi:hypothetical protein